MEIDLGQKLVSISLGKLVKVYWNASFEAKNVKFDCSSLEWIANSEIAFLFSWINALEEHKVSVTIQLQSSYGITVQSDKYKKRKYCLERLLIQWRLKAHVSKATTLLDGGIQTDFKKIEGISNYSAIPIQQFDQQRFDEHFEGIFNQYLKEFADNIKAAVRDIGISYYDSQFLDYSVFKELYSNVCLHSESEVSKNCFFSIGLNRKFRGDFSRLSESRLSELSEAEQAFFSNTDGTYRNIDFIEIAFHDFGVGIAASLRNSYLDESEASLRHFLGSHYETHMKQNEDTRIIEYALLLFTSRFEIGRKLDIHNYIPRGLYILKELVKQYHGYFEIASGKGVLGLSFKGDKTQVRYRKNETNDLLFPGTRIKIVFPKLDEDYNVQQDEAFVYHASDQVLSPVNHIHLLKIYAAIETKIGLENNRNTQEIQQLIIGSFFSQVLSKLNRAEEDSVILVDFAGSSPSTIDFYNKFIYFITHFPLSSKKRMVFYNLLTKGLNQTLIGREKGKLSSKGIVASTIPCIHVDHTIEWLGVDVTVDADRFTKVWKLDEDGYYSFTNLTKYKSSIISVSKESGQYRLGLRLPSFYHILESIDTAIQKTIEDEIENKGIHYLNLHGGKTDHNHVSVSKPNTCYLNPRGKIVLTYLSFTEKLYIISYRRMIASYFIYKLFREFSDIGRIKRINKILSVTLSSQMIGHEVAWMMSEVLHADIKLVALSNYYNFQNEEKFSEITRNSKVLVVNDVISTGTLTMNILKSIEIAEATPVGCLAIVNMSGVAPFKTEVPIVSLAVSQIEYQEAVPKDFDIEVINPVMNVPTSMPRTKSNEHVLMSKEEFFGLVDERFLQLGNLKNNSVYFNYYINTKELLEYDESRKYMLVSELLKRLSDRKKASSRAEIENLIRGVDIVSKNLAKVNNEANIFRRIRKDLEGIHKINEPGLFDSYEVDVVFYPFLSNISVVERDYTPFVASQLNSFSPKIFSIPRIMTTKGWRFSFPPKFLNHMFEGNNLSVLVLDDGTLSGDTIMQMIDSVSFLSVKSIDVLSIFGRVEDFQKELFSRIKSVQVKNAVVPVNVYFGVHVNVPVQNQFDSSFQTEYRELVLMENKLHNEYKIELSDQFESYLEQRKKKLLGAQHPSNEDAEFHLFPAISKVKVFELRDFFGRFGSYRLYKDDLKLHDIEKMIESELDFMTMLTVLNLEPNLYQTFKRMYAEDKIKEKVDLILHKLMCREELMCEDWMKEFFIKALFYLSPKWFFEKDRLLLLTNRLFEFSNDPKRECFRYLEYMILMVTMGVKNTENSIEAKSFAINLAEFISQLRETNEKVFAEMRLCFSVFHNITSSKNLDDTFYINKYQYLREYFLSSKVYEDKHDEKLLPNVFRGVLKACSELRYSFEHDLMEDVKVNTQILVNEIEILYQKYSKELKFGYIRDIVRNLKHFASTDLPFDVIDAMKVIDDLESLFNDPLPPVSIEWVIAVSRTLDQYQDRLLKANSMFVSYFMTAKGNLLEEWAKTERACAEMEECKGMVLIDREDAMNVSVNVHPYALNLAFENLLKNKGKYAKKIPWRMKINVMPAYTEMTIEQDSAFDKTGDGTGQSAIKSILRVYGVQYKRIKDHPYTLKITFSNKFHENERA